MKPNREQRWRINRLGFITASEVEALMTKSGKFDKGALDLLYQKQWERNSPIPYFRRGNANFDFGNQNEPLAVEWLRANKIELGLVGQIKHCSSEEDFPEDIVFVRTAYGLAGSPDVQIEREGVVSGIVEIKCVEGSSWFRYTSPTLSLEAKKALVLAEHREQLAAQLLLYPEINHIYLLKYRPQIDNDELDLASPLDPSRGVLFRFERSELQAHCDETERRVMFCDAYLNSGKDLEQINKFCLRSGKIINKPLKTKKKCLAQNAVVTEALAPSAKKIKK